MKLAAVQSNVKALLEAHPRLAGVPIVLDDGLGEANKERVAALKAQGLSLLVWRIESGGIVDASSTGAVIQHLAIFVFIEENVAVCRAPGGVNVHHEDAAQYVMEALSGARVGPDRITLDDPPFDNLGKVNGVNRMLVNALAELTTEPRP
ncbi:MAG TPA: hypothetical protein PKJ98_20345 [Verrucomicrobiota bacterium]|nr:hypothetical protein [Verrucomicrobiota bacterium]